MDARQSLGTTARVAQPYPVGKVIIKLNLPPNGTDGDTMHDLLQLMYQDGHLSSTELEALKRTSRQLKENPVRLLRSLNIATPGEIKNLLQRYYGFAAATDKLIEELDDSFRSLIPADLALHYCVIPIAEEKSDLYVLMEDPTDKGVISQLQFFLDRRIVPVIATMQQLTNGLCRLYGVEPARLKLSGILETSRGAVGVTSSAMTAGHPDWIDDSQPLLDDEVFKKLKIKPQIKAKKTLEPEHNRVESQMPAAEIEAPPPAEAPQSKAVDSAPPSFPEAGPELSSALNVLGLKLSLAGNRTEAIAMANERLAEFDLSFQLTEANALHLNWSGSAARISLETGELPQGLPPQFRSIVKKFTQCRAD
ncbi:MAG: hypothetical protein RIR26_1886 [Pseudomonadota bacterium]|jgi:hypothetical protein